MADKEKKRSETMHKLMGSMKTRSTRVGSYSVFSTLVVIAIAVAVVLAVSSLPSRYTQLDMTREGIYSLSDQTKELCAGLAEDVTVYWITQTGSEESQLVTLLSRYEGLSDRLVVTKIDPVDSPNFADQYGYQDELQYNNSLIVVCGDRSKFVDYGDIFVTDYSGYYTTGNISVTFNGESALTGAIDYVTSADLPKVYILGGHGEAALSDTLAAAVESQNILTEDLSLLTSTAVPDDCDCLLVSSPANDISAEEKDIIQTYLENGGHMLLVTDYTEDGVPNLQALMENYGTTLNQGIVLDDDSSYNMRGYAQFLLPTIGSHEITSPLLAGGYKVLVPLGQGLTVSGDLRSGLTVTQLLTTSDSSFSKVNASSADATMDKEEGDIDGPFAVGVAVEENETRIVWFTSSGMLQDDYSALVSGANQDIFINSLNWMCERENRISISPKNMDVYTLSLTVPTRDGALLALLMVGILPLLLLATGIVITVRRRRR